MAVTVLRRINAGTRLHRIHRKGLEPVFFGPAGSTPIARFDAPDGSYKILYAARTLETAFAETMARSPAVPYVLSSTAQARVRSELVVTRTLRLFPLIDASVSKLGLSFTDLHGDACARTWEVSGRIHATTPSDGILYTSRFDNQPCIALFDRSCDAIEPTSLHSISITHAEGAKLATGFGKLYVEP